MKDFEFKDQLKNLFMASILAFILSSLSYLVQILPKLFDFHLLNFKLAYLFLFNKLDTSIFQNYRLIPIIAAWSIIGAICYFLYYALSLIYTDLYNAFVLHFFYTKTATDDKIIEINLAKRILFRSFIILVALLILLFFVLLPFPFTENIRTLAEKLFDRFFNLNIAFYLSFAISFLYWLLLISLTQLLYGKLLNYLNEEQLAEEHSAIE
jgi:hypothetical protein